MAKRFVLMLGIVGLGLLAGGYFGHVGALLNSGFYAPVVTAFLALGLYGSTHAIDLKHLRADLRTVVLAVTVGVVLKAALISAVMLAFFPRPGSLVLGIAVAQIDPLSVVALGRSSRLSSRGRGLLLAWASFDDPVTTLLTIYVAALALSARHDGSSAALDLGGPGSFALDLLGNLMLAGVVFLLYRWVRRFRPWPRLVVTCLLLSRHGRHRDLAGVDAGRGPHRPGGPAGHPGQTARRRPACWTAPSTSPSSGPPLCSA